MASLKCAVLLYGGKHLQHNSFIYSSLIGQVVDCGLWNVGALLFDGCANLQVGTGGVGHAVDPEHQNCAQWVTCLVSTLAMQEVGHFQLQHELMIVDIWHHNHQSVPDTIKCNVNVCQGGAPMRMSMQIRFPEMVCHFV